MKTRPMASISVAVVLFLLLPNSASVAQGNSVDDANRDADELTTLVDGLVTERMEELNIPGLVISIVEGEDFVSLKGYGFSDVESQIPADPVNDVFRVGSLTKTFTFTAVMQQVEQGNISLDAAVNEYLSSHTISAHDGRHVLVRDLLSHRTGFANVMRYLGVEPNQFVPLKTYVQNAQPEPVYRPGEATGYSNYGTGVAGLLVEEVTGMLYEDYMEANVFAPLGMDSTTARQPLGDGPRNMDPALRERLATNYEQASDTEVSPYDGVEIATAPAGGMSTTAEDMTRYMLAHLGDGSVDSGRILTPSTVEAMRQRLYNDRRGPDFAHGFINGQLAGYDTYGHDGALQTIRSAVLLIPELGIGIFIGTNGGSEIFGPSEIAREIGEYMIGDRAAPAPTPVTMTAAELEAYTGSYVTNVRDYNGFFKIIGATEGRTEISVTSENQLLVQGQWADNTYAPLNDTEFINVDSGQILTFVLNDDGSPASFFSEDALATHEPGSASENIIFLLLGVIAALILSVSQTIAIYRQRSMRTSDNKITRWLWTLRAVVAPLALLSIVLLVFAFVRISGGGTSILVDRPFSYTVFLTVVLLVLIAAIPVMGGVIATAANRDHTIVGKAHYLLFAAALVAYLLALNTWNMVGYKYF